MYERAATGPSWDPVASETGDTTGGLLSDSGYAIFSELMVSGLIGAAERAPKQLGTSKTQLDFATRQTCRGTWRLYVYGMGSSAAAVNLFVDYGILAVG